MENRAESLSPVQQIIQETIRGAVKQSISEIRSSEKKNEPGNMFEVRGENHGRHLAGLYFEGIQYYDLEGVLFINNSGIANLIDLLKSLMEQGVEIYFVNVSDAIKAKINAMGLVQIIKCR